MSLYKDYYTNDFSRRDFLKISSLGLFSLLKLPPFEVNSIYGGLQARVIPPKITIYTKPSSDSSRIRDIYSDMVFPITDITIGDSTSGHNRVWYRIDHIGFVHSGGIQPVKTILNQPEKSIPKTGALIEVTVPYTDAKSSPENNLRTSYRFYYETTHWVSDIVQDDEGNNWYRIVEDKWEESYYAIADHFRLVPSEELMPISNDIPSYAKKIIINTIDQTVIAYEFNEPVFLTRTATGAVFSNGDFSTPPGTHITYHKRPSRHMSAGNLALNGYDLPGVPWICYFTEDGVAFHGTYWHNNFGSPRSHGCVNLSSKAAKWIYRWTHPIVPPTDQFAYKMNGTRIEVIS